MADSLTRKFLSDLGIEDEKIDSIIDAHVSTVKALTQARADLEAVRKENDSLKKGAGDYAAEKARADKAVKDLEDYRKLVSSREKDAKIEGAYRKLAKDAHIDEKRLDTVVKWARAEGILQKATLKDDGTFDNADKLAEDIKAEWADFVTTDSKAGSKPSTPPGGSGSEADDLAAVRKAMGLPDPK